MKTLNVLFLMILTTVWKVKAITGGHPGQSPHQAFIKGMKDWQRKCSGTIISDRLILTTAIQDWLTVVAGVNDVNSNKALVFLIKKITVHPDYVFVVILSMTLPCSKPQISSTARSCFESPNHPSRPEVKGDLSVSFHGLQE